jgi:hypothetical protein
MNTSAWDFLYLHFSAQELAYAKITAVCESLQAIDIDNEYLPPEGATITGVAKLLPIYQEMIENIQQCQHNLTALMTEKELTYLISALIFHCDERVLTTKIIYKLLLKNRFVWPCLQQQLVQCRNGGERFFNHLDELILQPLAYPLALEVYYFCLKQGFRGCYFRDPEKIKRYLAHCTRAIKQNALLNDVARIRFSSPAYEVTALNAGNRAVSEGEYEATA